MQSTTQQWVNNSDSGRRGTTSLVSNMLSFVSFAGMTLNECIVLQVKTFKNVFFGTKRPINLKLGTIYNTGDSGPYKVSSDETIKIFFFLNQNYQMNDRMVIFDFFYRNVNFASITMHLHV